VRLPAQEHLGDARNVRVRPSHRIEPRRRRQAIATEQARGRRVAGGGQRRRLAGREGDDARQVAAEARPQAIPRIARRRCRQPGIDGRAQRRALVVGDGAQQREVGDANAEVGGPHCQVGQVATGHESAVQGRLACRAVVVEDNHDVAQSLATLLSMLDVSTSVAYDGLAGLALIEEQRPDVAIVDIGMPGMNGYEVANRVRDRAWGRRIMLVALTGWGQDEDKRRAYAAGFDVHMVKPVALPDLQALLARVNADARPSTATTD